MSSPSPSPLAEVPGASPTLHSTAPIELAIPGRAVALQVRVTAPVVGDDLPIIVLSHGHGPSQHLSSLYGYGPLANVWASRGFCVIQPTHLDSMMLGMRDNGDAEAPLFWRSRATDISHVLDHLSDIQDAAPWLIGRINPHRAAVAGHSMGGHTASLLLGTQVTDPQTGEVEDLSDPRIRAGVVLAGVGRGGDALTETAKLDYGGFANPDFSPMTAPTLVVYGDDDASAHLTVAGAAWHADPYHLAPGRKALLTLFGAGHGLGGVSGYDAAETTDEDPNRVRMVGQLTAAYLLTQLGVDDTAWGAARDSFNDLCPSRGEIEEK